MIDYIFSEFFFNVSKKIDDMWEKAKHDEDVFVDAIKDILTTYPFERFKDEKAKEFAIWTLRYCAEKYIDGEVIQNAFESSKVE